MKKFVYASAILVVLSGCATTSIPTKEAQLVPSNRIFHIEKLPVEGNASAIFVRDAGLTGSGVYQHLFIDGHEAALLNPGEKVEFVLAPGEHIFGVIPTDPFGTHSLNTIDQELKSGKRYFYRIQTDGDAFRSVIQRFIPEVE